MKFKIDVSVIIPALNEEKNIGVCLESIVNQKTKVKYEIIVCDGRSDDKTKDIAVKYADKVILSKDRSIGIQRNYGAKLAAGRYLLFVDADTVLPDNYISWGINKFKKDKDLVGFCARFKFSNSNPKAVFTEKLVCSWFKFNEKIGSHTLLGFNTFVTAKAFKQVGGFRDVPLEDADLARRMHKIGKLRFFTDNFVITSSRRLEKMGLFSSVKYYFDLGLLTNHPNLKFVRHIVSYKNYVGYRFDSEELQKAFVDLNAYKKHPSNNSFKLTAQMKKYIQEKAENFTEDLRQEFNETNAWAKRIKIKNGLKKIESIKIHKK